MIEKINVFDIIIILGAIQGIIFSIYLSVKPLKNTKSSFYLVLFIMAFALNSIYYVLETIGVRGSLNFWDFSPFYCSLLIVASLYLFVRALKYPKAKLDFIGIVLLSAYLCQFLFQLWGSFTSLYNVDVIFDQQQFIYSVYDAFEIISLVAGIVVLVVSIRTIINYDKTLQKNYADIGEFSLSWLNRLIFFVFGIWILFLIPTIYVSITKTSPFSIYYPIWISTSILIYWIGYSTFFRRRQLSPDIFHLAENSKDISLSENTLVYHSRLKSLLESENVFLDQELNLKSLAEKLAISSGYLSQIINQYEKKNFFDYINSYRVDEVKSRIANAEYNHMTLLGIAFDCGFKSKSTFNLSFKKNTGMTPFAYKKSISQL